MGYRKGRSAQFRVLRIMQKMLGRITVAGALVEIFSKHYPGELASRGSLMGGTHLF